MDEPTVDNLAGLLALLQMITFSELQPKKSRALLRAAVGHYKELQDAATSTEDVDEVQRLFGLALYVRRLSPRAQVEADLALADGRLAQLGLRSSLSPPHRRRRLSVLPSRRHRPPHPPWRRSRRRSPRSPRQLHQPAVEPQNRSPPHPVLVGSLSKDLRQARCS